MSIPMARIPAKDRPRERLDRLGPAALTDSELLALVIRSGAQGSSALDVGQELVGSGPGLGGLSELSAKAMCQGHAIGPAKAASLVAAFELGRRASQAGGPAQVTIRGPEDIAAVARSHVTDAKREESIALVLNSAHRVIRVERLTVGTDDRCLVEPRDILGVVLRHGGRAFALVHTHPSGNPTPSSEDTRVTRELSRAAETLGLRFVDHVILAGSRWKQVAR